MTSRRCGSRAGRMDGMPEAHSQLSSQVLSDSGGESHCFGTHFAMWKWVSLCLPGVVVDWMMRW